MAQLTITNGESGLDVRNALNSMFTEIYAKVDNIAAADGRTFHVNETYGAVAHYTQGFALVGLDATDAIQEAIDDCVAAGGGTVVFNPGFYRISGALRTDRSGRAQIALPVRSAPTDLLQVAVRLYCHEPAGSCAYVDGITAASGAVLCSTLTGQTIGGGGEVPSVIGGPATTASSTVPSDFTNIFVIVDGIAIVNRSNPTLTGFDFGKVCRCYLKDFRVETPDGFGGTPNCTSKHAVGVILPQDNNNVLNQLESGQVKGYYAGIIPGEHCHINGTVGFYENNIAVGVINGFTHNLNLGPYMAIDRKSVV